MRYWLFPLIFIQCLCINAQTLNMAATIGISISHPKDFEFFWGNEAGIKGEYMFIPNKAFYFSPALSIANKGWNMNIFDLEGKLHKWECDVFYLEVPLYVGYKHELSNSTNIFFELGPYLAIGLWGHSHLNIGEESFNNKNVFLNNYRRIDSGGRINIGFGVRQWRWSLGYSHNLIKPTKGDWKMINQQGSSWHLNISYIF